MPVFQDCSAIAEEVQRNSPTDTLFLVKPVARNARQVTSYVGDIRAFPILGAGVNSIFRTAPVITCFVRSNRFELQERPLPPRRSALSLHRAVRSGIGLAWC